MSEQRRVVAPAPLKFNLRPAKLSIPVVFENSKIEKDRSDDDQDDATILTSKQTVQDEHDNSDGPWLIKGLLLCCKNGSLADGKYQKSIGIVENIVEDYGAELKMAETGDVILLDQDDCETVQPNVGGQVMILRGLHRGKVAKMVEVRMERREAAVEIDQRGRWDGHQVLLPFKDFTKFIQY
jgi:hypothetical protein